MVEEEKEFSLRRWLEEATIGLNTEEICLFFRNLNTVRHHESMSSAFRKFVLV